MSLTPNEAALIIRAAPDPLAERGPMGPAKLKCSSVYDVAEHPDARGFIEVLYLDGDKAPHTAWLRGREVIYTEAGW